MRKTFNFNKIDYNGIGRKINPVKVDIELKETDKGCCFSASGVIYNQTKTDCLGSHTMPMSLSRVWELTILLFSAQTEQGLPITSICSTQICTSMTKRVRSWAMTV